MSLAAYERVKLARDSKDRQGLTTLKMFSAALLNFMVIAVLQMIPLLWVALQSFVIFP